VGRLQEVLGRRKCMDHVSMRAEEIVGRRSDDASSSMTEINESVDKTGLS